MAEYGRENWKEIPGFCPKCNFIAKNLDEGKKYVFRVRAENLYGTGDALEGKPVVAKSPFDPPGPPGIPQITAYSPSMASLQWEPPTDTGGKPITGKTNILQFI